jgi:hypothetical protein
MPDRSPLLAFAAVVVAGCALGGCGSSDEDEIRDVSRAFLAALRHNDGRHACELMTLRASAQLRAQLATWQDAAGSCENVIKNTRPDQSRAPAAVSKARLTSRSDLAVLRFGGDTEPLGLRRVDGSWRVDNLLNPRLNETPRRRDQALREGSDATQIKAMMRALSGAAGKRDYRRVCDLISPGLESTLLVNAVFSRMLTHPDEEPSDVTCAGAFKEIEHVAKLRGQERMFDRWLSALRPVDGTTKLSIRGAKAAIRSGASKSSFIKLDGQWLFESDPAAPAPPAGLTRCWRRAGARIAIDASDLRFAVAEKPRDSTRANGRVSAKGDDWRIFYALLADGADPGLARVVSNPTVVPVVAYIRDATAHRKIVENARRCGD